ncbi:hypothetical protein [Agriterribacter sp.]|uniref:hypothetical protein n=1 Tax=Agriterribacter sp. TaxID=2821509 RepID=UPI002D02DCA8|nr:hypothetical protein [Agriterribacter sp.]HRO47302.1 hypothetical protein [Agriterribacter sp.]HRQ18189.1 hypothetical protein [Agriterribacter sp.]
MKEYLLLRNNTESGPYSLDELRVMGLKAYDLIWVEKRSFSWKYPSEISELSAFAPPVEMRGPGSSMDDLENRGADRPDAGNRADWALVQDKPVAKKKAPVKQLSHIVALQPTVEHMRIRTIKSVVQPHMVKVEIREKELIADPPVTASGYNAGYMHKQPERGHSATAFLQPVHTWLRKFHPLEGLHALSNNNKMEMIVLAVGAASLLAVAYLFITTGY